MYRTKEGAVIVLSKITHLSHIMYDDNGEYRRVFFGENFVGVKGDDCLSIEKALDDSFGGTIWKWQ